MPGKVKHLSGCGRSGQRSFRVRSCSYLHPCNVILYDEDSKLAEHHNVMVQRSSQKWLSSALPGSHDGAQSLSILLRRNQLLDELRKKEAEVPGSQP